MAKRRRTRRARYGGYGRYGGDGGYGGFAEYVPAAERRRREEQALARFRPADGTASPVRVQGRAMAHTFWGRAWCENLEAYSDFANRLPRGRTYVRRGAVWDLRIAAGKVTAQVIGSQPEPYLVEIGFEPAAADRWRALTARCAGGIASVVELLEGRLSRAVMEVVADRTSGLFPAPAEIRLSCSCPDWASLCKHVAAALYGVGARLDQAPELLFVLRGVDHLDLIAGAGAPDLSGGASGTAPAEADLASIFGIDLDPQPAATDPRHSRQAHGRVKPAPDRAAAGASRTARGTGTPPQVEPEAGRRREPTARPARPIATGKPAARKLAAAARVREVTIGELLERGVPRTTLQNWPKLGVLVPTGRRGVFTTTPATEDWIARALARRGRT